MEEGDVVGSIEGFPEGVAIGFPVGGKVKFKIRNGWKASAESPNTETQELYKRVQ